jgi:hypothetical protein
LDLARDRDRSSSHLLEASSHFLNLQPGVLVAIKADIKGFFKVLIDALWGESAIHGEQVVPNSVCGLKLCNFLLDHYIDP